MKTKELKIRAPKGYEIDTENSTFECIKFKPIQKYITYEDVYDTILVNDTYFINDYGYIRQCIRTDQANKILLNKNIATNKKQLEKLLALNQLLNIAEYYNKLHPKRNKYCLYYILFEKECGCYSIRPHYTENDWLNSNSIVAFFNSKFDAQAVIDNPNFREILNTIYN